MNSNFQYSTPKRLQSEKVLSLAAIRSLDSQTRLAIVGALRSVGPSSMRELAEYLHRTPDGLYYHVRHLMRVGIVEKAGRRPVYRRYEALYRLTAGEFMPGPMASSAQYRRASIRFVRALFDLALRYYATAIQATPGDPEIEGVVEFYMANARLTPSSVRKLKTRLRAMFKEIARNEGELGQRTAVTVMMTPVLPGRKAPGTATPRLTASRARKSASRR